MLRALVLALALTGALAASASAAVTREGIAQHLRALAAIADANGGNRAASTPGDTATADYLAAQLRESGYEVRLQTFDFAYFEERRPPVLGGLRPGTDFVTARQSAAGEGTGRVRLIRRPGCRRSDFRPLRRGELALVRGGDCTLERVAAHAAAAGAVAMLLEDSARPLSFALRPVLKIPVLQVERRRARRLARSGRSIPVSVDSFRERRQTRNVIAELGTGKRVVMAGGHLDSVPESPGINDNGTGIAAIVELARELAANQPAGTTLRFGLWGAEEWGLRGSTAYVRSLTKAQRRRIAGYVNLDMIGSPNPVPLVYGTRSLRRELHRALGLAAVVNAGSSDDAPFAKAGIPAAGVYTGGTEIKRRVEERLFGGRAGRPMDPCYHRACDALETANTRWAARVANATFRALRRFATRRGAR